MTHTFAQLSSSFTALLIFYATAHKQRPLSLHLTLSSWHVEDMSYTELQRETSRLFTTEWDTVSQLQGTMTDAMTMTQARPLVVHFEEAENRNATML